MKYPKLTILFIVLFFIISFVVQSYSYINWDVSWLLRCGERILNGGHYYTDFFETNPPLVIWLGLPVVLLSKILHVPITVIFRLYFYLLITASLLLNYYFCKKLFKKTIYVDLCLLSTALFYLLYTAVIFGERENFCIIFILPYVFMRLLSLENNKLNRILRVFVSVVGGLGFLIKPYFLLPFILFELYLVYRKKKVSALFSLEPIIVAITTLFYVFLIFTLTPNYVYKVVPLSLVLYTPVWKDPLWNLLRFNSVVAWLFATIILLYFIRKHALKNILYAFWWLLIGFWLVYFWQHKGWYYHVYPAIVFCSLLVLFCWMNLFENFKRDRFQLGLNLKNSLFLILFSLFVIVCIVGTAFRVNAVSVFLGQSPKSLYRSLVVIPEKFHYQGPALVLTANIGQSELLYRYTKTTPVLVTPSFFLMASVLRLDKTKKTLNARQQAAIKQAWHLFNQRVYTIKPGLIITQDKKPFLKFLLKNQRFNAYFSHYKLLGRHGKYQVYRYQT